jgi:hypothetical protein
LEPHYDTICESRFHCLFPGSPLLKSLILNEREREREEKLLPPKETSEARTAHSLFSHLKREQFKTKTKERREGDKEKEPSLHSFLD